jgi:hypothetical protein
VLVWKKQERYASKTARLIDLLKLLSSPWLRKRLFRLGSSHVSPLDNKQSSASHCGYHTQNVLALNFFVVEARTQTVQKQAPAAHIAANNFSV